MKSLIKKMRNTYVHGHPVRRGLMKGYAIAAFVAQIVIAVMFFFGIADAFGKKVYLLESINLILDVFSGYWVVGVGGALLAILYYVFLIIMIKNIVVSIRFLTNCVKDTSVDTVNKYGTYIAGRFGSTFFSSVIFLVVARMVSAYTLSPSAITVIIVGMTFYIAYWVFATVCEPYDLTVILARSFGNALSAMSVMLLFTLICKVDVPTVYNNLMFFFNSIGLFDTMSNQDIVNVLFHSLISPVFLIVIQIMTLKYAERMLIEGDDFRVLDNRSKATGVFWACMIYAMVLVVSGMFVGTASNVGGLFGLLKNNISWICCAVVIFVSPKAILPTDVTRKFTGALGGAKKKTEKSKKQDKPVNENKVAANAFAEQSKVSATKVDASTVEAPTVMSAEDKNAPVMPSNHEITVASEPATSPEHISVESSAKVAETYAQTPSFAQPNPNMQGTPNMYSGNYAPQGQPNPNMQGNPNMYGGNYAPQGQPNPNMQGNPNMYNRNYAPQGQPVPNAQGNPNMYNRNYAPQGQPVPNAQGNPNAYNANNIHGGTNGEPSN